MTSRSKGAELEQQVARFIATLGYETQTNVIVEGRSGARHEIDVLGEKRDALAAFRVAIECKAWANPIEKDVVAKFNYVLNDVGIREGIVVALGGTRSGADVAASELGITIWGPDDLREKLGDVNVADMVTHAPQQAAPGLAASIDEAAAQALIDREVRGRFGIGAETVAWSSVVWLPVTIVQIALSRMEGRFKRVTQTRRVWNAYDRIDGGHVCSWQSAPPVSEVDIASRSLRPKQREATASRAIAEAVKKYESVSTEAARNRHATKLAALGLPSDCSVVPESTIAAFTPLYVAIAHRNSAERVVAVDAHLGRLHPGLGVRLSENIHWLRESLA